MPRDKSLHKFRLMVRRNKTLPVRFRRGRDKLFIPIGGHSSLRRRGGRNTGSISCYSSGNRLPQILRIPAQNEDKEEEEKEEKQFEFSKCQQHPC